MGSYSRSSSYSSTRADTRTNNVNMQGVTAPAVAGSGRDSKLLVGESVNDLSLVGSNNQVVTGDYQEAPDFNLGDGNIINFTLPDFFGGQSAAPDYSQGSLRNEQAQQISLPVNEYGAEAEAEQPQAVEGSSNGGLILAGLAAAWGFLA